jgi:hypothetical protein
MPEKVQLKIDENRITLDDLIKLEEGETSIRFMRDLFSRFLVDENGEYLPDEEAIRAMGALYLNDLLQVKEKFIQFVNGLKERAVPPEQGGS